MKLTILGSGTCVSGVKGVLDRQPPAFLVEWDDQRLLFEVTEGIRFRLQDAGVEYTDIHHIAISHPHQDHCMLAHFYQSVYVKGVFFGEQYRNERIHVYCPKFIADHFWSSLNFYLPEREGRVYEFPELQFIPLSNHAKKRVTIGTGLLSARNVWHGSGKCDALAFRLQTPRGILAYSGDSGHCEGLREVAQNADIFICESSHHIGQSSGAKGYGHLNPFEAGDIARKSAVKKLILVHYTGADTDQAMIDECRRSGFYGEIVIGKDLQTFEL